MRDVYLTPADVIEELKSRQGLRTQTEFAGELGMTQGHLALVYGGKRKPTEKMLELLKVEDAGQLYKRKARK
jgi:DNA-binding transcriptional regulator YiaG